MIKKFFLKKFFAERAGGGKIPRRRKIILRRYLQPSGVLILLAGYRHRRNSILLRRVFFGSLVRTSIKNRFSGALSWGVAIRSYCASLSVGRWRITIVKILTSENHVLIMVKFYSCAAFFLCKNSIDHLGAFT